ncbi:MAG: flagellar biosynthetic protein FliO [Acidobacteriaceae bacterium]
MATATHWTVDRQEGWAGAWLGWIRSLMKARAGAESPLQVEGRISLGAKKSLVLVNCRGREVLLAVSGDAVTPVMELPRRSQKAKP